MELQLSTQMIGDGFVILPLIDRYKEEAMHVFPLVENVLSTELAPTVAIQVEEEEGEGRRR